MPSSLSASRPRAGQESGGIVWSLEQAQHCQHAFFVGSGHLGRAELLHTRSATHGRRGGSHNEWVKQKARGTPRRSSVIDMRIVNACINQCNGARSRLARHPSRAGLARPAKHLTGLRLLVRDNGFLLFACAAALARWLQLSVRTIRRVWRHQYSGSSIAIWPYTNI